MNLNFDDAGDTGTGHQLDLIALLDEIETIGLLADGTAEPLALIRIGAQRLRPAIGDAWADALLGAANSAGASVRKIREAADRADSRGRSAMRAGETFLRLHKRMEATVR